MTDPDGYVAVTAVVLEHRSRTTGAIKITHPETGEAHWIPGAVLHGGDEIRIKVGVVNRLRVRKWKAKELDL